MKQNGEFVYSKTEDGVQVWILRRVGVVVGTKMVFMLVSFIFYACFL